MVDQVSPVEAPATPVVDPIKEELAQQMAISLNGGIAPVSTETVIATATQDLATTTSVADPFGIFKEKFGYETPEAAVLDIETLRAFRAAPPSAELKFENEQSKRVVEALQAGKFKEVYEVLDQQIKIDRLTDSEMTADIAADIVKLGMQIKYKDLSPTEINYKFNKQFASPAKPGILPAEDQDEYNERVAAWQLLVDEKQMDLMIEAKLSKPDLLATKSKLVFPTIDRPQDAAYLEWQKTIQDNESLAAETTQAYKAFTPKSIETKIKFVDEANKVDLDFSFEPDPDSFNQAIEMTSDINNFWKAFIKPDGTPDRQKFLGAIYFALNKDKVINQALKQSMNATIKASLPDNNTGGLVRNMPQTQEPNELDAMMKASLKGYGGF